MPGHIQLAPRVRSELSPFQREFGAPALRLLRSINWATIPLHWQPLFLRGVQTTTTAQQAADAQARLVKGAAAMWEDAEVVAEAVELLHDVTTVSHLTGSGR